MQIFKKISIKKKYPIILTKLINQLIFEFLYSSYENKSKWIKLNKTVISKKLGRMNKKISKLYTTDN